MAGIWRARAGDRGVRLGILPSAADGWEPSGFGGGVWCNGGLAMGNTDVAKPASVARGRCYAAT